MNDFWVQMYPATNTMFIFRLLIFAVIAICSIQVKAGIYFDTVSTTPIEITDDTPNNFDYQFSVTVRPRCTSGCSGSNPQNFRLSLSDESIGNGAGTPSSRLKTDFLSSFMKNKVRFVTYDEVNTSSYKFNLGQWSGDIVPEHDRMKVQFQVKLNKKNILGLINNGVKSLDFYLVGWDYESLDYVGSEPVSIPVDVALQFKISGLDDIRLNSKDVRNGYLTGRTDFCVYATGGAYYRLLLNAANNSGGIFGLKSSGDKAVNYTMYYWSEGTFGYKWTRNQNGPIGIGRGRYLENCGGENNATLMVEIKESDLSNVVSGGYSDIMTVTVSPI